MLSAIAVLLLLMGVSTLLMGAVRHFFPSVDQFVPSDFKQFLTLRTGFLMVVAGVALLNIFNK
ncbi:MAG: hypothetical protein V3V19_08920 [Cocleimonas sp.]